MPARLHASAAGSPHLPPLVMLHGFGMTGFGFSPLLRALSERFSVLAFDLPGHGGSLNHPLAGSARKCAEAVQAELETRGLSGVHLVGHSFGGAVAALVAMQRPPLVSRLTLLAPGGFAPSINAPLLLRHAAALELTEVRACLDAMSATGPAPDDLVQSVWQMRQQPGQIAALQALASRFLADGGQGVLPLEALAATAVPTRLVWGAADPVVPVIHAVAAPDFFRKTILAGAGHALMHEAPAEVLGAIFGPVPAS